jgi:hypothetical protein
MPGYRLMNAVMLWFGLRCLEGWFRCRRSMGFSAVLP